MQRGRRWMVLGLLPCACGPTVHADDDSEAESSVAVDDDSDVDEDDSMDPNESESDASGPAPATTSGADASAGSTEAGDAGGGGESSTGESCDEEDECRSDDDCPRFGASCSGCTCHGGTLCEPVPDGEYEANCLAGEACGGEASTCLADESGALAACVFACADICDCPSSLWAFLGWPPKCGSIDGGDPVCHLSCADGEACPPGWICMSGLVCAQPMPPSYADCLNYDTRCPPTDTSGALGTCLELAAPIGTADVGAICSTTSCVDADDCPDPPETGSAPAACVDVGDDGTPECVLDCSLAQTCPDGTQCHADLGICYATDIVVGDYGYCYGLDDCSICFGDETASVCTPSGCSDDADCPPPPTSGGTVTPQCGGLFPWCMMQCSADDICPDGMVCHSGYCMTPAP